jgi:hypothetical protein
VPSQRPIFRYSVFAFLFAITVVYEFLYLRDILRGERITVPFFATEIASNKIIASAQASAAGVHDGDRLIAVEQEPPVPSPFSRERTTTSVALPAYPDWSRCRCSGFAHRQCGN